MSDFSKLELLVESKNAVQNLNKVESSLNKTDIAANKLKSTLKTIGLGIGFTALLKQTLQLSNATSALNKRMDVFFGSSGNNKVKELTSNFALADRSAKELLTTAGKFGSANGLGGTALTDFSAQLSKLAADVAAFYAIDDVNSVLERFGAATLGRTQGLKEFGVAIDTTSDSFKKQVTAIQATTGATEAQAKQIAILQEAQRQLQQTEGSAGEQVSSAWQQLNNLFDNFKDILSQVGNVFNTIFGPIIRVLNSILEIPFVKSITGWIIAITALTIGLGTLVKISSSLSALLQKETKERLMQSDSYKNLLKYQAEYVKLLKEEENIQKNTDKNSSLVKKLNATRNLINTMKVLKITDTKDLINDKEFQRWVRTLDIEIQAKFNNGTATFPNIDDLNRQFNGLNKKYQQQNLALRKAQTNITNFSNGLQQKFNVPLLSSIASLGLVPPEIYSLITALELLSTTTKENTIVTYLNIAAKKLQNAADGLYKGLGAIFSGSFLKGASQMLGGLAATIGGIVKGLWGFVTALGEILIFIWGIYDAIRIAINAIIGEPLDTGLITKWVVDKLSNMIYDIWDSITGITLRGKKIDKARKDIEEANRKIAEFDKSYQSFIWKSNSIAKKIAQASDFRKQIDAQRNKIERINREIENVQNNAPRATLEDQVKRQQRLAELKAERDAAIKEIESLDSQLAEIKKIIDTINDIRSSLQDSVDQFRIDTKLSFDEKTGKLIDDKSMMQLTIANKKVQEFSKQLADAAIVGNKTPEEMQKIFNKFKSASMEVYRIRMKNLEDEKNRLIENYKAMQQLLQTSIGYQQTGITAVQANTMEAAALQTREKTGPTVEVMKNVAEQSKQIKDINKVIAETAKEQYNKFVEYVRIFDNYIKEKTGNKDSYIPVHEW